MEVADHEGEGQEEERRRHQVGDKDPPADRIRAAKTQAAESVAGEDAAEERDRRRNNRDDGRVDRPMPEVGLEEEDLVPLQRGRGDEERALVEVEELGRGFERRHGHPVEGEQRDQDEKQDRDVNPDPATRQPIHERPLIASADCRGCHGAYS